MERGNRPAGAAQRRGHLHETAGVSARVGLGLGLEDPCRPCGRRARAAASRLHEVVDAGAAAAELLLGGLEQVEARESRCKRRARLGGDPLRVLQVARVLERDAELERVALGARRRVDEQLGDVDDVRDAVILQVRAAARGVRDDRVVAARGPRASVRARATPSSQPAGVSMQGAAAALRLRHVDVVAVGCEDARRRGVHVAEDDALDAAGERARPRGPPPGQMLRAATARSSHGGATGASGANGPGAGSAPKRERGAQPPAVREDARRSARAAGARRASGGGAPRRARVSSRSAGRTARPRGRRARTPCSRGSGRSARRRCRSAASSRRARPAIRWMRPRGESISSCQSA